MTIQQISVFLENRAGQLAEIVRVLSDKGIDLRAIHIAETADYGVLRLIAARSKEAADLLLDNGFILSMNPVVPVTVPDRPGGLSELLTAVAGAGVDIEYIYSMLAGPEGQAAMLFRVEDPDRLEQVLTAKGFAPASLADLGVE